MNLPPFILLASLTKTTRVKKIKTFLIGQLSWILYKGCFLFINFIWLPVFFLVGVTRQTSREIVRLTQRVLVSGFLFVSSDSWNQVKVNAWWCWFSSWFSRNCRQTYRETHKTCIKLTKVVSRGSNERTRMIGGEWGRYQVSDVGTLFYDTLVGDKILILERRKMTSSTAHFLTEKKKQEDPVRGKTL